MDIAAELLTQISEGLRDQLHHVLAGQHPSAQGAALADLLAMWLVAHPPQLREEMLRLHIEFVRKLIPVNARIVADRYNLKDWDK